MMRVDGRKNNAARPIRITRGVQKGVPGSVLIEQGDTHVICSAIVEERVPPFLKNSGKGWITAEYAMLPGSSGQQRINRDRERASGRSSEIQRFVGRALRTVIDLRAISEYTIQIDTDVLQADGSTRCAAINGGMLALALALKHMVFEQLIAELPRLGWLGAVSLGVHQDQVLVDLDYKEDSAIDMDINLVSTAANQIVELSAFGEGRPVPDTVFGTVLALGLQANRAIIATLQQAAREAGLHV
jgi:ribonuclease PH